MRTNGKGNPKHDRSARRPRPSAQVLAGRRLKPTRQRSKYDAQGNLLRERRVAQRP